MKRRPLVRIASALTLAALPLLAAPLPEDLYREMRWRMIGPHRGGRTRAVAGVHGNPDVLYIGATNGGVWKSGDYGRIWTPIFDDQPTQSIGAIAVAPSAPNVVYFATGEGLQRPDLSVGNGVYRSDDSGRTWTHLGLRDGQQIPAIVVAPRNPNYLFAAVLGHPYGANEERGIYRSTDGAETWTKVLGIDASTGGSDVDIDPSNPDVVYAAMWQGRQGPWEDNNSYGGEKGGIYKSTDSGTTWTQLAGGLPPKIVQANVAIAPSNPRRLYAVLAARDGKDSREQLALYRSDDAGASWKVITDDPRPAIRIGGGGDLAVLGVDPKNEDVVYSASIVAHKSIDGGRTWTPLRGAPGGDDYQNIWIDPVDPNVILLSSDQGAVVSVNGGATWSSWYNQPTAQLYHVQASNTFPYYVCSGQQESGSVCISTRGEGGAITYREWRPVGASEYGYAAPDPLDGDIVYGAGRNEVTKYRWSTAQTQNVSPIPLLGTEYRVDRTQPIIFSPADPHVLYYAANVVFSTRDGGATWSKISPDLARKDAAIPPSVAEFAANDPRSLAQRGVVYALAPSFKTEKTIWAGTDDGLVWVTRDGGAQWQDVTPPGVEPWSKVTQIAASPFDDATSYVSVSRFRIDGLRPYVYRTHDGGKSWTLITKGLPDDGPVNSVREDLKRKGLLFSATENAVYVSFNDGDDWQPLTLNLPHTSMRDLWIHDDDLIVATHGRSFWVLDDLAPLRQANAEISTKAMSLFDPSPAVRVRRSVYPDTPIPADEPRGENPPSGAIIDYYVGRELSGSLTLEIVDAKGQVVRRYSSGDRPEISEEELRKQPIPAYWMRPFRSLPMTPGMHRWVWDLRYEVPEALSRRFPISAVPHDTPRVPEGPLVLPGEYGVRLSAGGQVATTSVQVKADPRMKTAPSDLQRQVALERKLASMMTTSVRATKEARKVADELAKSSESSAKPLGARVRALLGTTPEKPETNAPEPLNRLASEASSLYGEVGAADAAPTAVQMEAAAKVERELERSMARWEEVMRDVRASR